MVMSYLNHGDLSVSLSNQLQMQETQGSNSRMYVSYLEDNHGSFNYFILYFCSSIINSLVILCYNLLLSPLL